MIDILNRCDYLYRNLKDCDDKYINEDKKNDCLTCTKYNFRRLNIDSYDCLKKLCTYTMYYGPLYVSEIYSFLRESKIIENNFLGLNRQINVMSLGCGFGPDDISLSKYKNTYLINDNVYFNYGGYDVEPLWKFITQTNAKPITYDLLMGMNFQNIDIVFINKLFSTLRNLRLDGNFLTVLGNALLDLPLGSFVIFNDINNKIEGRDDFDSFATRNNLQVVNKYYFSGYTGNYIKIEMNDIVTDLIENPSVAYKNQLNQTIIFLYQKV